MSSAEAFDQAVLDAEAGDYAGLADFGIEATRTGNLVRVACAGQQQLVPNTPEALASVLYSMPPELTYRDYCQH